MTSIHLVACQSSLQLLDAQSSTRCCKLIVFEGSLQQVLKVLESTELKVSSVYVFS